MLKKIIEEYYLKPFEEFVANGNSNTWTPIGTESTEIADSEIILILKGLSKLNPADDFEARKIINIADKLISEASDNEL